jgi:hypothetical protein
MTRKIIGALILLLGLEVPVLATASANYMEAGVGTNSPSHIQFFEYGRVNNVGGTNFMLGGGHWWVKDGQNSFFFRSGVGYSPQAPLFMPSFYVGPSYITNSDDKINRNFAVYFELNLMLIDSRNMGIGLTAKHFSTVNDIHGRDFYGLRVLFP